MTQIIGKDSFFKVRKKINGLFAISLLLALVIVITALCRPGIIGTGIKGGESIVYDESLLSYDTNWKLVKDGSVLP